MEITNIDDWISANRDTFLPPICSNFLHKDGQLTVMLVGGPNSRCDFHIQRGEEFFYQLKGKVLLKIFAQGRHRDVIVNEGEVFHLPPRVPHSPQRFKDTMGLVLERKRAPKEFDILRFYIFAGDEPTKEILYQTTFHWDNAVTAMPECLEQFLASEERRTGVPQKATDFNSPFGINCASEIMEPFDLKKWIDSNEDKINNAGRLELFDAEQFKYKIFVYGAGQHELHDKIAQTWLLQLRETSEVNTADITRSLRIHDSLILQIDSTCRVKQERGSYMLACTQHP